LFNLDRLTQDNSIRVVTSRQVRQQSVDIRRDVYDSHRHRVFALAFYMTGNEVEAEEILTSTFVTAFRKADTPDSREVDSALMAELRKRFMLDRCQATLDIQAGSGERASLEGRNVRRTELEEAIHTLPADERLLFLLRDVEGYSLTAISELLTIPEAKVQRGLISARIRLRRALAKGSVVEIPAPAQAEPDAA